MTKVTLAESVRSKLNSLNEEMERCDESGRTLGHFLPPDLYRRFLYAYVESQCPYTREELERMSQGDRRPVSGRDLETAGADMIYMVVWPIQLRSHFTR